MKRMLVLLTLLLFVVVPFAMAQETCEGNFDCDQDVDGTDAAVFKVDFGRSPFSNPCPNCPPPAPVEKTGQTTSYATGDDGDLERGVELVTPWFTDNSDGTVTDNQTGLIWLKDANCIETTYPAFDNDENPGDGEETWQHALDFVAGINDGTYPNCGAGSTKWRLPNSNEVANLVHKGYYSPALSNTAGTGKWSEGDPFTNVQTLYYWSSTTNAFNTDYAWRVYMALGDVNSDLKSHHNYVWPVRGGH